MRATYTALILLLALTAGCTCEGPITEGDTGVAGTDARTDARATTTADSGSARTSSCKRGLAYGHHSVADFVALQPAIAWWYNWHHLPDEALRDGSYRGRNVDYVPMVWGRTFDATALIADIPEGTTTLLGFNEPNFGSQADISATEAAALWPEVERIADARDLVLVSPAVNFCGGDCQDTDPFRYLDAFFAACPDCRVDRIAMHIYVGCRGEGDNQAQWLINHVRTYESRFTQPLWLTEFACDDAANEGEQIAFMEDAVAFLESDPRIERYAWFSGRFEGIPFVDLLDGDGALTALGRAYVNAPTAADCTERTSP